MPARCSAPRRAWCCWPARDALPSSSPRLPRAPAPAGRAIAPQAAAGARANVAAPAPADLEFFNGLGGFADGRAEYVTVLGAGQTTPAPWVNVDRESRLRLPGLGRRRRLHLGREQPREPAHALVERSGQPTRPARRSTSGTRRPARSGRPRRCPIRDEDATSPATARATAGSSTSAHGIALELLQFVPLDDPIKISRLTLRNRSGRAPPPVRHRLCRVGAGQLPRRRRAVRHDRDRSRHRRDAGPQRLEHRSSAAGSRSPTSAANRRAGPAIAPSSSAATAALPRPLR